MLDAIDGFDPLVPSSGEDGEPAKYLEEYTKGNVRNILDSYTGYYDVFSESIQNALDAVQQKAESAGSAYTPKIWIDIDLKDEWIRVVDNGIGMDEDQFKYCFRPHISHKRDEPLRGKKGVGATFLAYGYSHVTLQTKRGDTELAASLEDGRFWVEDTRSNKERPKFNAGSFRVPELEGETSGTCIEIEVGTHRKEKPKDLTWQGAQTAEQWFDVLRIKTPLGGIYLTGSEFRPEVTLRILEGGTENSSVTDTKTEYYYPHEIPGLKQAGLKEVKAAFDRITGDAEKKERELPQKFRKLDCLWEVWDTEELLDSDSPWYLDPNEADRALLDKHNVTVYAAFLRSVNLWDEFNDNILSLRKGRRILRGGLQMASDYMPQGGLITIPLKRKIGYQHNTHVIVHFVEGGPDMGRKVFQPEYTELAKDISRQVTRMLLDYRGVLRQDTGAKGLTGDSELFEWKRQELDRVEENPLGVPAEMESSVSFLSPPQVEQDVIGLFHQLLAGGLLRGYEILATSAHERYDGLFRVNYSDTTFGFDLASRPLGVNARDDDTSKPQQPSVLEYKYELSGLVRDFEKEEKDAGNIDLLVCWSIDPDAAKLDLRSYLIGDAGEDRLFFGATHKAIRPEENAAFEVLCLSDLLSFCTDREAEEIRQKDRYGE